MRYRFIRANRSHFRVVKMCEVLEVSTSGYYSWFSRPESRRSRENRMLLSEIREIHGKSRETYGSPRVAAELRDRGLRCGRNRVARIMRDNGICAKMRRKFKRTTDSRHNLPVAANLLDQDFAVDRPNSVWAGDISVPQQAA